MFWILQYWSAWRTENLEMKNNSIHRIIGSISDLSTSALILKSDGRYHQIRVFFFSSSYPILINDFSCTRLLAKTSLNNNFATQFPHPITGPVHATTRFYE